jgi:hypothetical protein
MNFQPRYYHQMPKENIFLMLHCMLQKLLLNLLKTADSNTIPLTKVTLHTTIETLCFE